MKVVTEKRRRTKKPILRKGGFVSIHSDLSLPAVSRYESLLKHFEEAEVSYQSHQFLRNLALSLQSDQPAQTALPTLLRLAKIFMLNELEIVVWSLFLTRIVWRQAKSQLDLYLSLSALSAKAYFDSEVAVFEDLLRREIPDFDRTYQAWKTEFAELLEIGPTQLRQRFEELRGQAVERPEEEKVDYNEMIVAILQMSPPLILSLPTQECTPADLPLLRAPEDPRVSCADGEQDFGPETDDVFRCWETNTPLPRFSSLSEIWPDLSPKKRSDYRKA